MKTIVLTALAIVGPLMNSPVPAFADGAETKKSTINDAVDPIKSQASTVIPSATPSVRTVHWRDGKTGCSTIYKDDVQWRVSSNEDILVMYSVEHDSEYETVRLGVTNQSKHPVDVLPFNCVCFADSKEVSVLDPRSLNSGAPPTETDSERRLRDYENQPEVRKLLSGKPMFAGGFRRDQVMSYIKILSDAAQRDRELAAGSDAKMRDDHAMKMDALLRSALKANTLLPGESTIGTVLYATRAQGTVRQFRATIDGCQFIFDW